MKLFHYLKDIFLWKKLSNYKGKYSEKKLFLDRQLLFFHEGFKDEKFSIQRQHIAIKNQDWSA
jgi:hypothetical protein